MIPRLEPFINSLGCGLTANFIDDGNPRHLSGLLGGLGLRGGDARAGFSVTNHGSRRNALALFRCGELRMVWTSCIR